MDDTVTIPKQELYSLLNRLEQAGDYAKEQGNDGEYDGIRGAHDELYALIKKYS